MGKDSHERRRRRQGPPFVQIFHYVIDCKAYRRLSTNARGALIELARRYNGRNNGQIGMSARDLGGRLGVSHSTAARALSELEEAGFIEVIKAGTFRRKDRLSSEYRLAFHRCDVTHDPPSRAFMRADH